MSENTRPRCIVLGGSGALGRRVCRNLAEAGAELVFSYRSGEDRARGLEDALSGAVGIALDAAERGAVDAFMKAAIARLGGLDALVHCIGIGLTREQEEPGHPKIGEIDEDDFDRMMAINVRSAFSACRGSVEALSKQGGNIVLTASIDGVKSVPAPVHYAASKAALIGLCKTLSKELGPANIRVNVIAPGVMNEGISRTLPPDLIAEYEKHCGLKRRANPEEISAFFAYLALENSYLSGQVVGIDGGL